MARGGRLGSVLWLMLSSENILEIYRFRKFLTLTFILPYLIHINQPITAYHYRSPRLMKDSVLCVHQSTIMPDLHHVTLNYYIFLSLTGQ